MKKIIILGAGGSGFDIISIIHAINNVKREWEILGFLDDNRELCGHRFLDYNVIGTIDDCVKYEDSFFVSSIAHSSNRYVRQRVYDRVKEMGGNFATIIHPSVVVYEGVKIEDGCVFNANCVIGSNVSISNDVHFSYSCNIGHECRIGAHSAFGNGVNLSSSVTIGKNSYVGCGVSTTYDIIIPENSLVTVGSAVTRNLKNHHKDIDGTFIGNPAELSYKYMMKQHMLEKLIKSIKSN